MIYMHELSLEGHTRTMIISGERDRGLKWDGDLVFTTYHCILFELIPHARVLAIQKVQINSHFKLEIL